MAIISCRCDLHRIGVLSGYPFHTEKPFARTLSNGECDTIYIVRMESAGSFPHPKVAETRWWGREIVFRLQVDIQDRKRSERSFRFIRLRAYFRMKDRIGEIDGVRQYIVPGW